MFRFLRAQLVALNLVLVLLVAGSTAVTYWTLRTHDSAEETISFTRQQRELIRRMAWVAFFKVEDTDLESLMRRFDHTLQSIRDGGLIEDEAGRTASLSRVTDPATLSQLNVLTETWTTVRSTLQQLSALERDDPDHSTVGQALLLESLLLLDRFDKVVDALEEHSEAQHELMILIQALFLGIALLLLTRSHIFTTRRIVRALNLLGAAAQRIGKGELSQPVPTLGDDEIGLLAHSMETMREEIASARALLESRVAERTRELSVAFEFSQDITQQLERERLFESITERARVLMQAEAASLCLVTPDGTGVQLVAHSGGRARGEKLRQPVDNEPTLQVLGEGRTMLTDLGGSSCTFLDGKTCDQCLATPLQVGGHNVGAICILRGSRAPFEEEEKRALELLANSAAIAIANAHLLESERRHAEQTAAAAERERLAAELHDHLAQTLSFINLKTDRVEGMLADAQPEAAAELTRVKAAIEEAYAQVRAALTGLAQPSPGDEDFVRRLAEFIAEYRQTTGLRVDVVATDGAAEGLSPLAQKQALYIVREALANVRRHAGAQAVRVQVAREDGFVHLAVNDDGNGFDPQQLESEGHLGLTIMRTRAERCGGQLSVESAPGQGTTVVARLPLDGGEKELGR